MKDETVKVENEIVEEIFEFDFEQEQTEGGFDEIYFVKAKTKNAAHFEFSRKQGNKTFVDPREIRILAGKLTKLTQGTYTYEDKEIKTITMNIVSELGGKNILFMLNLSYTQVGRSIINSILGVQKPIGKIYMELYSNKAGYASIKLKLNDKQGVWKYSLDEQRAKIETIKNKKGEFVSNDYTELDDFLEAQLKTHLNMLFPENDAERIVDEAKTKASKTENKSDLDLTSDEASEFFEIDA